MSTFRQLGIFMCLKSLWIGEPVFLCCRCASKFAPLATATSGVHCAHLLLVPRRAKHIGALSLCTRRGGGGALPWAQRHAHMQFKGAYAFLACDAQANLRARAPQPNRISVPFLRPRSACWVMRLAHSLVVDIEASRPYLARLLPNVCPFFLHGSQQAHCEFSSGSSMACYQQHCSAT